MGLSVLGLAYLGRQPSMIVCHCWVVTDRTIRAAIEAGAVDLADLARRCRAGSGCGGCTDTLRRLLVEHKPPLTGKLLAPPTPEPPPASLGPACNGPLAIASS